MRLGFERIVKDKRISIILEESDNLCVVLTLQSGEVIRIKASAKSDDAELLAYPEMQDEIRKISDAVHEAYMVSISGLSTFPNNKI